MLGCAGESILGTLCVFVLAQGRCQQTGSEMRALIQKGLTDPKESRGSGTKKNSPKAPNEQFRGTQFRGQIPAPATMTRRQKRGHFWFLFSVPFFLGIAGAASPRTNDTEPPGLSWEAATRATPDEHT